jgi:hypothetical protein
MPRSTEDPVTSEETASFSPPERRRGPWRAIILALFLCIPTVYWGADQGVDVIMSLMVPPVGVLLVVVALNALVCRFAPRAALTSGELVLIYAILQTAGAVSAEWVGNITPLIWSYGLYADAGNNYKGLVHPHAPTWMFLLDPELLQDFKRGGWPAGYFLGKLHLFVVPVIAWTVLISVIGIAMLCISALMRQQWTERERLSFPIIQLPLAMTTGGPDGRFWRDRLVWISFAVMFGIDILNGLNFLYPNLPRLNVRFLADVIQYTPDPPWNGMGWTPIGIFPFVSAMGAFMPTDLLFSMIFFFFVRKAQQVIAVMMGYEGGVFSGGGLVPSPPYFSEQSWGAFIGLFIGAIWVARSYLREVWWQIRTGQGREAMERRWALIGLIVCLILLLGHGLAVGLRPGFFLVYLLLFLVFSTALTRMRAQLGPPTHEMAFMGPNQMVVDFAGTTGLSHREIGVIATQFHFMNRIHRTHPMPSMLEAYKMGERAHVTPGQIFIAITLAIIAGNVFGHLARIYMGYHFTPIVAGGDTAGVVRDLTSRPRVPNPAGIMAVFGGMGVVLGLDFLRMRIASFPLHPAGYALAMNFGVDYYWFGLLIVLIIKAMVERYIGLTGTAKLRSVALGVMMGEVAAELIWSTMTMVQRYATYSISINGRLGWQQ